MNIFGSPTARGQQSTEQPLWWPDTVVPCGRCQATCHQFYCFVEWPGYDPTLMTSKLPDTPTPNQFTPARALPDLPPTLPREDFRFLFDNILLTREPLLNALAPVPAPVDLGYDWTVRYERCNWRSAHYGLDPSTGLLHPISNSWWYLYYGDSTADYRKYNSWADRSHNGTQVVAVPHVIPDKAYVMTPAHYDGIVSGSDGVLTVSGWTLALVQEKIVPALFEPALATVHRHWAMFTLDNDVPLDDPQYTVFNCQQHNVFVPAYNQVIFPRFLLHLVPANHS